MFAVIDFETTSRIGDRRATEVAVAVLDANLNIVEAYETLVNPGVKAYQESLGHSRLTQKEIDAAPSFADLWPDVARLLSNKILIMHNADFDCGVLANELEVMDLAFDLPPTICTLATARRVFPARKGSGGYQLEQLNDFLGGKSVDSHRASIDVAITVELFRVLHEMDSELRRTCEILKEVVVLYPDFGFAKAPKPRVRHQAGGQTTTQLAEIAKEINSNPRVQKDRIVCLTGVLEYRQGIEEALKDIGFTLEDKETTKGTAFLIQGVKAGARKVNKALHYGRPVLTEAEAMVLVEMLS